MGSVTKNVRNSVSGNKPVPENILNSILSDIEKAKFNKDYVALSGKRIINLGIKGYDINKLKSQWMATQQKYKKTVQEEEADSEEDDRAERAGDKVAKDIEYDDKKDKKLDEWANDARRKGTDAQFEQDIEYMTKIISGGLNKPKSTGQTTVPVIANQVNRTVSGPTTDINESLFGMLVLAGLK